VHIIAHIAPVWTLSQATFRESVKEQESPESPQTRWLEKGG
jgi:hypothetical protein